MLNLQAVEANGKRVLTTKQIAEAYGADVGTVQHNFRNNKSKYVLGKHYILLEGKELQEFKTSHKIYDSSKHAKIIYLWTEKGALLHAKSINTDKAWEVYDYLVDFYFRAKDGLRQQASQQEETQKGRLVVDAPENSRILEAAQKVKDDLICMNVLLDHCNQFISKDEYERRRRQMMDVVDIIMADTIHFTAISPNIVRKVY